MRITRLLIGWTTLAGLTLVPTAEAWACQCEPTGPPCQNAFQVDAVFAATARSISALPEDGPPLRPGAGRIPRAVRVDFGDVSAPRDTGARLYGTINHRERDPATGNWRTRPVPDAVVAVRGLKGSSDAWTDAQGRYEVTLPPGTYEITAFPPPVFSARHLRRTVELRDARGCFVVDFDVRLDVRVNGVVRYASGEPAMGVVVEVMAAEDVGKGGNIETRRKATDASGRFEFIELPPGRYVVGVDLTRGLNREIVFPKTFHPGTPDAALATIVQLDGAQQRELEPLTLPPARRPYRLTGTVVFEDGRPASGEDVVLRDGSATRAQVGGGRTGLDGTFSILVHEGLSYVASAVYWDAAQRRQLRGTVGPFFVTGDTGPLKIVLSEETYRERQYRNPR